MSAWDDPDALARITAITHQLRASDGADAFVVAVGLLAPTLRRVADGAELTAADRETAHGVVQWLLLVQDDFDVQVPQ